MNIITTDNSLAYVISDNTTGSGKMKRGGTKKAASTGQDVLTSSITKYLDNNAKAENSNAARLLAIQEEQLKLDQRKMDLQEKQHALAEQQLHYHGQGYGGPRSEQQHYRRPDQDQYRDHRYDRPAPDQDQYHDHRYGRPAPDQDQYHDHDHRYGRPAPDQDQYHDHRYGRTRISISIMIIAMADLHRTRISISIMIIAMADLHRTRISISIMIIAMADLHRTRISIMIIAMADQHRTGAGAVMGIPTID
jgi:hypothetical protein